MILSFCGGGLSLRTDVSFADLETQFIGEILGQVAHLPVLLEYTQQTHVGQKHIVGKSDPIFYYFAVWELTTYLWCCEKTFSDTLIGVPKSSRFPQT